MLSRPNSCDEDISRFLIGFFVPNHQTQCLLSKSPFQLADIIERSGARIVGGDNFWPGLDWPGWLSSCLWVIPRHSPSVRPLSYHTTTPPFLIHPHLLHHLCPHHLLPGRVESFQPGSSQPPLLLPDWDLTLLCNPANSNTPILAGLSKLSIFHNKEFALLGQELGGVTDSKLEQSNWVSFAH